MVRAIGHKRIEFFEDIDPQFTAIKDLANVCGSTSYLLTILNAAISYRLSQPGEVYWSLFSEYARSRCISVYGLRQIGELVKEFAYMYNRVALDQKLRRLEKMIRCRNLEGIAATVDLEALRREIALCLNVDLDSKTVIFSVKMAYYVHRALGKKLVIPMTIPIPVDIRVATITYLSGAVDIVGEVISNKYSLLRYSKTIRGIWSDIGRKSLVPPLNLDALIWYFGKYSNAKSIDQVYLYVYKELYPILKQDEISLIVRNLFYRLAT